MRAKVASATWVAARRIRPSSVAPERPRDSAGLSTGRMLNSAFFLFLPFVIRLSDRDARGECRAGDTREAKNKEPAPPNRRRLKVRTSWPYCLRHCVPFDQSIVRLSPETNPIMFQGGPMLTVMALVTVPDPTSFFSFLTSRFVPVWVTVNVVPDH